MSRLINIIVNCSSRKTALPAASLTLRTVKGTSLPTRAAAWVKRLKQAKGPMLPASELYAGQHWSLCRDLPRVASEKGFKSNLWVCSAGFGLVPLSASLPAYAATFSPGHADSVLRDGDGHTPHEASQLWWKKLATWKGPTRGEPRTIHKLATRHPKSPLVIVASKKYLAAIYPDLVKAKASLKEPDLLIIISLGTNELNGLSAQLLPANARLQSILKGPRVSLNARLAKRVINEADRHELKADRLGKRYQKLLDKQPALKQYDRTTLSDKKVATFIRKSLREDRTFTHSRLLRKLRDSGFACEQSRFASLYKKTKRKLNGS